MRIKPLDPMPAEIPGKDHPGGFGTYRKHDIHTGIDLYCEPNAAVYAIESGTVVAIVGFTGPSVHSPWWHETDAVIVKSRHSGKHIVYGEVKSTRKVGDDVYAGDLIANVVTVLKKDKGLPMTMLHLEYYTEDFNLDPVVWLHYGPQPEQLLDPGKLLGLPVTLIAETTTLSGNCIWFNTSWYYTI
jgi:murein DD-endopeptidase MepM/ murein hydrolase activator NlpD